jgi:hypothetical protein
MDNLKLDLLQKYRETFNFSALVFESRYVSAMKEMMSRKATPKFHRLSAAEQRAVGQARESDRWSPSEFYRIENATKRAYPHICAFIYAEKAEPHILAPLEVKPQVLKDIPSGKDLPCKPLKRKGGTNSSSTATARRSTTTKVNAKRRRLLVHRTESQHLTKHPGFRHQSAAGTSSGSGIHTGPATPPSLSSITSDGVLVTCNKVEFNLIIGCDCKKWAFPDFETFKALGLRVEEALLLEEKYFHAIPDAGTLSKLTTE